MHDPLGFVVFLIPFCWDYSRIIIVPVPQYSVWTWAEFSNEVIYVVIPYFSLLQKSIFVSTIPTWCYHLQPYAPSIWFTL